MAGESPIINILTYRLPFDLANQIYKEFQSRSTEAKFLIDRYKTYQPLKENLHSVELLLSLSIFQRRVVACFDGAVKFYGRVTKTQKASIIKIGTYELTFAEKNRILAVVINYKQLLEKYSIHPSVMDYYETREFLKKLIQLKKDLSKNKPIPPISSNTNGQDPTEDLPF